MARIVDKKHTTLEHDRACLAVYQALPVFFDRLDLELQSRELEAPKNGGFVDVYATTGESWIDLKHGGRRHALRESPWFFEIKTSSDEQSPAAWVRQLRHYARGASTAALVVIPTFELDLDQEQFLQSAGCYYFDIDELQKVQVPDVSWATSHLPSR